MADSKVIREIFIMCTGCKENPSKGHDDCVQFFSTEQNEVHVCNCKFHGTSTF